MKEGWEYKKLDEICDFRSGFAFKSNKFTEKGEPIIRISDIQNEEVDDSSLVYFDPKSYTEDLSKYLVYPDDILIAMSGGTTGKIGINKSKRTYYLNQRVGVFRENKKYLNHKYLFYYLHTKSEESLRIAAGAAQPNLSTAQIKSFIIPVPPLPEQQSIVDYLDAVFAKIDAMKANAEKALNEAKALFQASLKEMLEPKEGWEEKPLNKISNYSIGLTYKPSDVNDNGTIVLRSSNIQNDKLDLRDIVRVSCPIKEVLYVQEGDILMCSRNGSAKLVGKVAIIPESTERMTYGTFMMIIRSEYNPFLFYFFKSDNFRNQIKHGEANMINQITRYMLNDVVVNIPPKSEVKQIVTILDSLKSKADRFQANFDKISQECDALKQAILRQVFE